MVATGKYGWQVGSVHPTGVLSCYRQQTKLREGNVFTPVCQSFHSQGVGVYSIMQWARGMYLSMQWGCLPPWADIPPDRHTLGRPPPRDGHCSGGKHPTGMHFVYISISNSVP